jgi:hypothetical protein
MAAALNVCIVGERCAEAGMTADDGMQEEGLT